MECPNGIVAVLLGDNGISVVSVVSLYGCLLLMIALYSTYINNVILLIMCKQSTEVACISVPFLETLASRIGVSWILPATTVNWAWEIRAPKMSRCFDVARVMLRPQAGSVVPPFRPYSRQAPLPFLSP
jgi:hypothetical protein